MLASLIGRQLNAGSAANATQASLSSDEPNNFTDLNLWFEMDAQNGELPGPGTKSDDQQMAELDARQPQSSQINQLFTMHRIEPNQDKNLVKQQLQTISNQLDVVEGNNGQSSNADFDLLELLDS